MSSITEAAIPSSIIPIFPQDLFFSGEFKSYIEGLGSQTGIAKIFKPRLYTYSDFILVKLYAMVTK
ncbi:MAG: hypothetical protein K9W44_14370 [Candidatus Lokiarchaeota archaeon]|nr:hypothetical protein [Candidatus Harpocratesius repetitus]